MTLTDWQTKRHFRLLAQRLDEEGFEVVDVWNGRHLRVRVRRNGKEVTVTCSNTPAVPEHSVSGTMQQARRGTRA